MLSSIKPTLEPTRMCWICGRSISLESCKVDEHGNAVHEECYAAKVALAKASPGMRTARPSRAA